MQHSLIKDAFKECIDLSDNIMDLIKSDLINNKIEFIENTNFEIMIDDTSKDDIINILSQNTAINSNQIKLLLNIFEVNNKVIIRQKSN